MQVLAGAAGALPVPAPISFTEIDAFNRSALADLTAAEIHLIRRLDQQFIRIASGLPDPGAPKPSLSSIMRNRMGAKALPKASPQEKGMSE